MALGSGISPDCSGKGDGSVPGREILHDLSLDRLRLALDLSPVPAMVTCQAGRIRMTNSPLDALFGYAAGQLTDCPVRHLIPQEARALHDLHYQQFLRDPATRIMGRGLDLHALRSDGQKIPVEVGLSVVDDGPDMLIFVTVLDLSQHLEGQQRLREALDASASAMILISTEGHIDLVNSRACDLLAASPDQLKGRKLEEFLPHPAMLALSMRRVSPAVFSTPPDMPAGRTFEIRALDGRSTPVQITLTQIGKPGSGGGFMATLVDMSGFIAQQTELKRRNNDLAALNEELTQFAYSASHDLRAPLSTIAGLLEICLEDLDSGEIAECRNSIVDALRTSHRNIHKVEAVLTLARAGMTAAPLQEIDLAHAIPDCWRRVTRGKLDWPAFTLQIDGTAHVRTEATTLMTAIENLLSNALQFQSRDRVMNWVSVRIRARPDEVSISVADNGVGILETEQLRVFEIFRRSAGSEGHGLGLPLVQKHVRRLGGTIALSSNTEGTDVVLSFPGMEIVE